MTMNAMGNPFCHSSNTIKVMNPKHDESKKQFSHGIVHPFCSYVQHASISIGNYYGPNRVALQ
jgi:hypothetical protein